MADQVVLLRTGKIVQIGPPAELYDHPATDFAAQFLGTPPMNVLPVAELEQQLDLPDGGQFIGVRPEKIRLVENGLAVEVSAIDYMGAETVLRLRHRERNIMARVDGRALAEPGDQLQIAWDSGDLHYFDQEGKRI